MTAFVSHALITRNNANSLPIQYYTLCGVSRALSERTYIANDLALIIRLNLATLSLIADQVELMDKKASAVSIQASIKLIDGHNHQNINFVTPENGDCPCCIDAVV